ncbi:P-loop containing nucleoside triphosphate hydrolase protein, partial [Coprinellus micaceus]
MTQRWGGRTGVLVVKSLNPAMTTVLVKVELTSSQGSNRRRLGKVTASTPASVKFKFNKRSIGRYEDRIEFTFEDKHLKKRFAITRPLRVIVGNETDHEALKPTSPYVDPRSRNRASRHEPSKVGVVLGVPPPSLHAVKYGPVSLKQQIDDIQRMFLPPDLTSVTYARHFKHLLWIEEYRMASDIQRYDMSDTTLNKQNVFYYLAIPGLAEKRPSVLVGDRILFQRQNMPTSKWYEGHVHVVRQREVGLCFHTSFTAVGWSKTQKYNVCFQLNRIVLRRQHEALDSPFNQERVFFPTPQHIGKAGPQASTRRIAFCNPLIGANPRQAEAVKEIASLKPGSVPFIVFGPPGTGKTVTVVEAIRQLLLPKNPNIRILACAPSNSAADLIAERLSSALSPTEMLRISRLLSRRCIASSMLSGVGMPRGHFSWIFVDEAGQATEPEVCVPVKTLSDHKTNLVLSGDPKQLGPVVMSSVARGLGFDKSWLERLMARGDVYGVPGSGSDAPTPAPGQAKAVVKLTRNFRSHLAILSFPNERFYGGDLEAYASAATTDTYLNSPLLPRAATRKFPDDREASSPSFFNVDEVLQVKSYVQQLKNARGNFKTADGDIGVIAPYHAQCQKLRIALRSVADSVKVGSVEGERKAIIISTVRSSKEFVNFDLRHTLVAVTRAKALLIIVGNPHNGGWIGSPDIPWDPQEGYGARVRREAEAEIDELARRVMEVSMDASGEEDVN